MILLLLNLKSFYRSCGLHPTAAGPCRSEFPPVGENSLLSGKRRTFKPGRTFGIYPTVQSRFNSAV